MKKYLVFIVFTQILTERMGMAQNLENVYSETRCGLNYTQASVLLGKRMMPYGYPYDGADQPAPLIVSGIPVNATVEKAYLWWDIAGSDTAENVILQNPEMETDTIAGEMIGGNSNMCWGPGRAFRAIVTNLISGNGTYYISGLPTDTTFDFVNKNDVNGATLFIAYSDNSQPYLGNININEGYLKISLDTILETMNFIPPSDTTTGKAFMLISDMQGEPGTALKMNNGPFTVPSQDYWDFEQKNTVYVPGINYSVFGVRSPGDCIQLILTGIYFQSSIMPPDLSISMFGDVLTTTPGQIYQWYYNNNPVSGAIGQSYLASQSGMYYVELIDSFGCSFFSDTIAVKICAEKIKPNINFELPDSLWSDSVNHNLQWYMNGTPIPGAVNNYHLATTSGAYWVQAQDSTGCTVNSDIISVEINEVSLIEKAGGVMFQVVPNPTAGNFQIRRLNNSVNINEKYEITIVNVLGEKIYSFNFTPEMLPMDISDLPRGIYLLKLKGESTYYNEKIIIK